MPEAIKETTRLVRLSPNAPLCEVSAVFVGIDSAALDSAKEMLIAAYVKTLIAKGNSNDNS